MSDQVSLLVKLKVIIQSLLEYDFSIIGETFRQVLGRVSTY